MNYAMVNTKTNIVENVIVLDENSVWSPPEDFTIHLHDEVCIGWTMASNGAFIAPPKEFIEAPTFKPPTKGELLAFSASLRWEHETGGFDFNGLRITSDATSQTKISGAKTAFDNGTLTDTIDFKTKTAWVSANAELVTAVYSKLIHHIQECYSMEKTVSDKINSEKITSFEEILLEPWPT